MYIYCGNIIWFQWNLKRCSRTFYWRLFSRQSKNRIQSSIFLKSMFISISTLQPQKSHSHHQPTESQHQKHLHPLSRSFTQLQTRHCQLLKKYNDSNKARWYKTCIKFQPTKNNEKKEKAWHNDKTSTVKQSQKSCSAKRNRMSCIE